MTLLLLEKQNSRRLSAFQSVFHVGCRFWNHASSSSAKVFFPFVASCGRPFINNKHVIIIQFPFLSFTQLNAMWFTKFYEWLHSRLSWRVPLKTSSMGCCFVGPLNQLRITRGKDKAHFRKTGLYNIIYTCIS